MTREKCYKDLIEIFSKPGDFSQELKEGESYLLANFPERFYFVVSKKWGYWISVIDTVKKYFEENGNLDDGCGIVPSSTDIIGTEIEILDKQGLADRLSKPPRV